MSRFEKKRTFSCFRERVCGLLLHPAFCGEIMYQALYRKYRPQTFADVCGQEHITSVLKMQLQKGRVSHAYMFCGSRGTGKTTCAKILAKAVNCENPQNGEPCNECPSCLAIQEDRVLDVVEMDAASNNGVDHIRRLCDEVQFLPSEVSKRVYIIDEVHMLSTSAFNALLKTIEEPPAHVLFILATTEMNDIPATIMSRCQRFDFKRILPNVISKRLMKIAEIEAIDLEPAAADVIARLSDGAMRDALSLLEACQGQSERITADRIHSILGLGNRNSVISLCRAIIDKDVKMCLDLVNEIYDRMSDFKEVIGDLIGIYRDLLVIQTISDPADYVDSYVNELAQLKEIASLASAELLTYQVRLLEDFYVSYDRIATGKKASAEIMLIRLCNETYSSDQNALLARISRLEKMLAGGVKPVKENNVSFAKTVEPKPETELRAESIPERKVTADRSESVGEYEASLKLKNALQEEMFIKPWLPQIQFAKEGNVLRVQSGSFVKGMLASANANEIILRYASEIDPEIDTIIMEEKTAEPKVESNGFEGL